MPEKSSKPGIPRKSAFSCEACRKRKVKCNGANPSCSRCAARGETCVYSLAPTLSYTKKLEERVAQLEAALGKVQGDTDSQSAGEDAQAIKAESKSVFGTNPTEEDSKEATIDLARDIDGLKVGDDGRISYHGPTSLFQLPSGLASEESNATQLNPDDGRRERLINNAWRERAFEQLSTIPDPFQYLLDSHWCWIHPLFNFVYRPAFTRDMKLNGPYYSDVLLNAIISHSIRWCKDEPKVARLLDAFDGGKQFFERASSGLLDSVKQGNGQIPNVQALLLLSAQECGRGNRTQAWVYSGMAFRLVEDLGITIDSRKYTSVQFSDEDIEIRNRLFWSCYFWDKLVSLYFGRSPIIQDTPVSPPRILMDDTAELEVWTPHGLEFPEGTRYPPAQAHSTSCFMKMCSLAEILNQIIIHIYDPVRRSSEHEFKNCVRDQGSKLEQWWEGLPSFLKLIVNDLPPFSPPSHIVTLNCLYHTVNILLHRPMLCSRPYRGSQRDTGNAKPLVQCISSATSIIALYDLYRRTFGDGHVVLSLAYSIYTAASIFLLEIQALKYASSGTVEKLRYCIIALNRVSTANPVINTALGLINAELQKLHINITETSSHTPQPISPAPPSHLSPASSSSLDQAASYTLPPHGAFSFTPPPLPDQSNQTNFTVDPTLSMPATLKQDDIYDISPELFEAFSYVDPMATVGANFDNEWNNNPSL